MPTVKPSSASSSAIPPDMPNPGPSSPLPLTTGRAATPSSSPVAKPVAPSSGSDSKKSHQPTQTAQRIRENQRRSRARHRDYVESLQRRVQEYERQGVEASLQMQRAARDVAEENRALRHLLSLLGLANDDVEAYLKAGREETSDQSPRASAPSTPRVEVMPGRLLQPRPPSLPLSLPTPEPGLPAIRTPGLSSPLPATTHSPIASSTTENRPLTSPKHLNQNPPLPIDRDRMAVTSLINTATDIPTSTMSPTARPSSQPRPNPIDTKSNVASVEMQDDLMARHHVPMQLTNSNLGPRSDFFAPRVEPLLIRPKPLIQQDTTATSPSSPYTMSSDAATRMITQTKQHENHNHSFVALACQPSDDCTIKTANVFRTLDKS